MTFEFVQDKWHAAIYMAAFHFNGSWTLGKAAYLQNQKGDPKGIVCYYWLSLIMDAVAPIFASSIMHAVAPIFTRFMMDAVASIFARFIMDAVAPIFACFIMDEVAPIFVALLWMLLFCWYLKVCPPGGAP